MKRALLKISNSQIFYFSIKNSKLTKGNKNKPIYTLKILNMKKLILTTLVASMVFFNSCESEPTFISGLFDSDEIEIVANDLISASYQTNEEEIKFIIEDLLNTSDNRDEEFPSIDFAAIYVDMNNNNQGDPDIDKRYTISSLGEPCVTFYIDENATSACTTEFGHTDVALFTSSDKNTEDHIIYEITLRKEFIFSEQNTVGLIFVLNGDDSGGSIPFFLSPLYNETIKFSI